MEELKLSRSQKVEKLVKLKVFDKWKENIKNENTDIDICLNEKETWNDFISGSFLWNKTKEGLDFWNYIANI